MQRLERDAADLAAHRVEAREDDRLGRVVDDEVDAGHLLEGADVAALAADDAALHVVARDVDDRDGRLGGVVGGDALDGDADDVAGLLVGLFARAGLGLADDLRGVALDVVVDAVDELVARLVGGHAGERLEAVALLLDHVLEVLLALGDLALLAGELVLALVERLGAAVDGLLALAETVLERRDLLAALLVLGLGLLLHLEDLVLGLEQGFFLERLGLLLRISDHAFRLFGRARGTVLHEKAVDGIAEGSADDQSHEDEDDSDCVHARPPSGSRAFTVVRWTRRRAEESPRNRDTGRPSVRHRDRIQRSDTRIRRIRPSRPFRFESLLVLHTNRSWTASLRPTRVILMPGGILP